MATNYYIELNTTQKEVRGTEVIRGEVVRITKAKNPNAEFKLLLDTPKSKQELWKTVVQELAKLHRYHENVVAFRTTTRLGGYGSSNLLAWEERNGKNDRLAVLIGRH